MEIKLAIVGSRTFTDYDTFKRVIEEFLGNHNFQIVKIISGGCRGTDSLALRYSQENDVDLITFKPDWKKYGKRAGLIRNQEIIKSCDVGLAFWDGVSIGTSHSITLCNQYHKPCWVYNFIDNTLSQANTNY